MTWSLMQKIHLKSSFSLSSERGEEEEGIKGVMPLGGWTTSLLLVASFGTLVCSPVRIPPGTCNDALSPISARTFSQAMDPQRRGPGNGQSLGGQGPPGKATATRGRQAQPARDKPILLGDDDGSAALRLRKRTRSRTRLGKRRSNPQSPCSVAGVGSGSGGCGNSSDFSSGAQFPAGSFMSPHEILDRAAAWMEKRREYLMSLPSVEPPENMWNGTGGWQVQGSKMMSDKCDACMMVGTSEGVTDGNGSWAMGLCGSCAIDYIDKVGGSTLSTYRRCAACTKFAIFGPQGGRARRCSSHRLQGDMDLHHRKCKAKGCGTIPTYGKPGDKTPSRCKAHLLEGYVAIGRRLCQHPEGCETWPGYGDAAEGIARFCMRHKKDGDSDLVNRRCDESGCEKQAVFGSADDAFRVRFCAKHRASHHISIKTRNTRCIADGCLKHPVFGNAGEAPQFCKRHKAPGHCDVKNKRCAAQGCDLQPIYGRMVEGKGRAVHCLGHKEEGEVSIPIGRRTGMLAGNETGCKRQNETASAQTAASTSTTASAAVAVG